MNLNGNKNEFEILDTGNMAYQPRYPLTQSPASELQGMNINKCEDQELGELFVDSNAVRNAVVIGAKITATIVGIAFPPLKIPAQILSTLIPVLWPKEAGPPGTAEAQFTWEQMMSAVEEMIDQKVEIAVKDRAIETLQILQSRIRDYQQALCNLQTDPDNERFKEDVRREFNDAEDQAKAAVIQFGNPNYAIPLLPDYAQAANIHLLLLRDVVQYGEIWGFSFVEVQQYYFNNQIGNPGMKQLLATYTDHCVRWYNNGLTNRYETGGWNTFNDFRRNMTLMVMDVVSFWPTYDPMLYKIPTKSQLTRIVYTPLIGRADDFPGIPAPTIGEKESTLTQPPRLFAWLRELSIGETTFPYYFSTGFCGRKQIFQNTMDNNLWEEPYKGSPGVKDTQTLIIPAPEVNDDVWRIVTYLKKMAGSIQYDEIMGWDFSFTKSLDQRLYRYHLRSVSSGMPCGGSFPGPCDPCNSVDPCSFELPNPTIPCDDKALYSHRFAYMGAGFVSNLAAMTYFSYGWTHVSADANNLIDAERITQIPAVKGSEMEGTAKVIQGPGSTGGDLVQLDYRGKIQISMTAPVRKGYQLRIRYATASTAEIHVSRVSIREDDSSNEDYYHFEFLPQTYLAGSLNFNSFGYTTMSIPLPPGAGEQWDMSFQWFGTDSPIIIDKIEFIPIEGSVEEFEANQAVEKARKAVNALFTNDAKNALQLNVTDYAVDQAANLVECVSEEFHAQEKMILLDQVKFAKRLSQERNLLNYGDFESSDWSGENGWRTSPHVHVTSDNPIFKGRYLHMPGAMSPQFSNNIYLTYAYQKVDESKLKSYTRYLVRGFVGNSKDLELLVERYGKEVHVEIDVPNDIRYFLPMNDCGGFDRCKPASYQERLPHTCTCKNAAVAHTDCQCKDKVNRTSADVYTNGLTSRGMYADGFHSHKSCECKNLNSDMYQNGTDSYKSCGYKDPHVFTYHIDTGCVNPEENVGLFFALKIASENGIANIDNLEIIEAQPLTGEALARVKKREQKWKHEMAQKRLQTEKVVQAAKGAIENLFTNAQQTQLKHETLFPEILNAGKLVQDIPYVHHPFLSGALPTVPGMNFDRFQQLSFLIETARGLYEQRNLVSNGTFGAGIANWNATDGVTVQPEGPTSVLVLSNWSDKAFQNLRLDPDRGYVLRVTARKEGGGKGTATISDCTAYPETLIFTSCEKNTIDTFVTKTLEIFPDTDRIRIDIGETEGTFRVESVELICMEQMENKG